jgi:hypothetical protein
MALDYYRGNSTDDVESRFVAMSAIVPWATAAWILLGVGGIAAGSGGGIGGLALMRDGDPLGGGGILIFFGGLGAVLSGMAWWLHQFAHLARQAAVLRSDAALAGALRAVGIVLQIAILGTTAWVSSFIILAWVVSTL